MQHGIHQGDCVAGMRSLPAGSVDLAFADPPFNIGYEYDEYHDRLEDERYLAWSKDWIAAVVDVLKPDGTFWLAIGDEYAAELKVLMTRELGLTCRSWVVWYYTFGVNCKYKFSRSHAHLFYMVKDRERFTFNGDDPAIRVPSARQLVYGDKRANPKGRLPDDTWKIAPARCEHAGGSDEPAEAAESPNGDSTLYIPRASRMHEGWILRPQDLPEGFQPHEDTWYFPRVAGTFKERAGWHGCQMPEQLLARIIRACSNEGDVVLDPFAGSGSTLITAKKLGRLPLGFEMSQEYAERANERLCETQPGDALEGFDDPLSSAPQTSQGRPLGPCPPRSTGESSRQKDLLDALD